MHYVKSYLVLMFCSNYPTLKLIVKYCWLTVWVDILLFFKIYFLVCPIWLPVFSFFFNYFMKQDWVQESILAWLWNHFHLALGSNPQPFDREPSALPLDHSFRLSWHFIVMNQKIEPNHFPIFLDNFFRFAFFTWHSLADPIKPFFSSFSFLQC